MLCCVQGTRGKTDFARRGSATMLGGFGGRWQQRGQVRQEVTIMATATGVPYNRRNMKVVLLVVMSLLPLVAGDKNGFQGEQRAGMGLVSTVLEKQEIHTEVEDMMEEGSDSPWHNLFEPSVWVEEEDQRPAKWERSPRSSDPSPKGGRKKKKKKKEKGRSSRDCRMEKREMRVRDLGQGYDSDEIILFKFCVGTCQSFRGNYDVAVQALLANKSLPKRTARKVSAHTCCRPTRFEAVSFMDTSTTWRTIDALSAAKCECVG